VAPGIKSITDGTYPFRQPLYFYTTKPDAPGIREFIAFVLSKSGQKIVAEQGFSPLPEEQGAPAKEEK
jgi:ABC-type phosphate transport system substrate-binding protein